MAGINIILTGQRQVGKSTAAGRFLADYPGSAAGFRTEFDDRADPRNRKLLLRPLPEGEVRVPVIWADGTPKIDPAVFDETVPPLLAQSADLLFLDELGKFEVHAEKMRDAVELAFGGTRNVLAVVRLDAPGWMGALKQRPDVTVLTVTEENRDEIPEILRKLLK